MFLMKLQFTKYYFTKNLLLVFLKNLSNVEYCHFQFHGNIPNAMELEL